MAKLTPERVICPACGRNFTNRGYQNHVNKCKNMTQNDIKTVTKIRHSFK